MNGQTKTGNWDLCTVINGEAGRRLVRGIRLEEGANDPRVPLSEAEQIAKVLEQKGIRHELAVYADEGHGLAKLANRLDAYPRAVDFLDEVLGVMS